MSSEFDFDKAAAAMFGSTTPTAAQPAHTTTEPVTDEQTRAERLFGQPKAQPAPKSEGDQAQGLFGGTDPTLTHADAVQAMVNSAIEDALTDPQAAGEIAADWAGVFAQHDLTATDSKALADIGANVVRNGLPSAELVNTWTETAVANLQAEYGAHGAPQALQDARAYIASIPDAADMLNAWGLGSHPKVVALAAARGRAMRLAGKLKG